MKSRTLTGNPLALLCTAALLLAGAQSPGAEADATLITLTQTGCQFLEPEGADHDFKTTNADGCRAINEQTAEQRLAQATTLRLKPGTYRFRIGNRNVPYPLVVE